MKKIVPPILFLLACVSSIAQTDTMLSRAKNVYRHESIFLHTDKNNYVAGETIWLKAYLHDGMYPSTQSSGLMVQLIAGDSSIVSEKIYPLTSGVTSGNIVLPRTLHTGRYFLRAFSNGSLHNKFPSDFIMPVLVYNPSSLQKPERIKYEVIPQIQLINPNKTIAGIANQFYVVVKDQYQQPVVTTGFLMNEKNDTISEFTTNVEGVSEIKFIPGASINYRIVLANDYSVKINTTKDATVNSGATMVISWKNDSYDVDLESKQLNKNDEYYLIGEYQYQAFFKVKLKFQNDKARVTIPVSQLPTGICRLAVLSSGGNAICERFVFSKNMDGIAETKNNLLLNQMDSLQSKFSFAASDTAEGSYSLQINDPGYEFESIYKNENIINRFFLSAWFKNNNPAYAGLIENINTADVNVINSLLATEELVIPAWNELTSPELPANNETDENNSFIKLAGIVKPDGYKSLPKNPVLGVMIATADSAMNYFTVPLKDDGKFEIDDLLFTDTARIYYEVNAKIWKPVKLEITSPGVNEDYKIAEHTNDFFKYYAPLDMANKSTAENPFSKQQQQLFIMLTDSLYSERELAPITVVTTKNRREKTDEVDKKYTSNVFSGYASTVMDFINEPTADRPLNVVDYLRMNAYAGRMRVTSSSIIKPVGWGNGVPYTIFLDEGMATYEALESIDIRDVALIKVFENNFVLANEGGPAIAVYTKKGGDAGLHFSSHMQSITMAGYSAAQDFINPDDENVQLIKNEIHRGTLYWNPYLFTGKSRGDISVIFYNIHKVQNANIVLQGMRSDGRIIYFSGEIKAQ